MSFLARTHAHTLCSIFAAFFFLSEATAAVFMAGTVVVTSYREAVVGSCRNMTRKTQQ